MYGIPTCCYFFWFGLAGYVFGLCGRVVRGESVAFSSTFSAGDKEEGREYST